MTTIDTITALGEVSRDFDSDWPAYSFTGWIVEEPKAQFIPIKPIALPLLKLAESAFLHDCVDDYIEDKYALNVRPRARQWCDENRHERKGKRHQGKPGTAREIGWGKRWEMVG